MEETGIDLAGRRYIACHKLSVGEYYFYELEHEEQPFVQDNNEVEDAGWFGIDEIQKMECNVDISHFLDRLKRRVKKRAMSRGTEGFTVQP